MIKRFLASAVVCATAVAFSLSLTLPAHAEPGKDLGHAVAGAEAPSSGGQVGASQVQTAAVKPWIARLNTLRSQFGAPAVTENTTWSTAAVAHSRYMAMNGVVTQAEDPGLPYYTAAGDTSGRNSLVAAGWTTDTAFIDAWAASPFHLISMLHTGLATTGFGLSTNPDTERSAATLNVLQGRTKAPATTGWPRVWPKGTTSILELSDGSSPDPTVGCSAPQGSWYGAATIVDFGPKATVTSASATLLENGVAVPVCVRTAANFSNSTAKTLMAGKALVIPLRPLAKDKGYSGSVTTNLGTAPLAFDTGNPASGVLGDHNGDGLADILGIRTSDQTLQMYQTMPGPRLQAAVQVGHGWGGITWMSNVHDLNGDRRTDLVTRRTDGSLWVYPGLGRGRWGTPRQIGSGFGGMNMLTVMSDLNGDGRPELVGRQADTGRLYRYSFTGIASALNRTTLVGTGWGGMTHIFSPGDFSGDGVPDLLGIRNDGQLYRYDFNRSGSIARTTRIGHGWTGWTAAWSPGDLNGDGRPDMIGRRGDGGLFFYASQGTRWAPAKQIGWAWNTMRLLA